MGIYLPNMEMPKDDMKNIMILADGRVFQFSGYGNPKPLGIAVPVPEPHGRLIDASKKVRVQMYDEMTEEFYMEEMTIDDMQGQGWIDAEMSTVIPASGDG